MLRIKNKKSINIIRWKFQIKKIISKIFNLKNHSKLSLRYSTEIVLSNF